MKSLPEGFHIDVIGPDDWASLSENAHLVVFGEHKPASFDRIDYALICADAENIPQCYLTARELDHETVYWQFGGAFPPATKSILAWTIYNAFIEFERSAGRKRIQTYVENTNTAYLKFAMKAGFRIIGTRTVKGTVLLDHVLDFDMLDAEVFVKTAFTQGV